MSTINHNSNVNNITDDLASNLMNALEQSLHTNTAIRTQAESYIKEVTLSESIDCMLPLGIPFSWILLCSFADIILIYSK